MAERPTVVAAPDKFRGTATAHEIAAAVAEAAADAGWDCLQRPVADGGEGLLDVLGGANRTTTVTGPLGAPVEAPWRLDDDGTAVLESALASGLLLTGGAAGNDPLHATSRGTGELIAGAVDAGATAVAVGLGGSATTDGGLGAIEALEKLLPLPVPLHVLCDVTIGYLDAARVFGPQKGATAEQVGILTDRLHNDAAYLLARFGLDVTTQQRTGAAGGLAGALAAIGGELRPGFAYVAERIDLAAAIDDADLVVTGEGRWDDQSSGGKAVGGVVGVARNSNVPVLIVTGVASSPPPEGVRIIDLTERFGAAASLADPLPLVRREVARAMAIHQRNAVSEPRERTMTRPRTPPRSKGNAV